MRFIIIDDLGQIKRQSEITKDDLVLAKTGRYKWLIDSDLSQHFDAAENKWIPISSL